MRQEYAARSVSQKCKWSLEASVFGLPNVSSGSHRMHSTPSSENAAIFVRRLWPKEAHLRLNAHGFYKGLVTYVLCQEVPKSQSPKKKVGVQHKPHCLHKQSRYSKPFEEPSFQSSAKDQSCKKFLLKTAASGLCIDSFLHRELHRIVSCVWGDIHTHIRMYTLANNWVREAVWWSR